MKRVKARTFQDYFESHMGVMAWKKGRAMYEASKKAVPLPDGRYNVRVNSARFEIPRIGWPQVLFEFEVVQEPNQGQLIAKGIAIDRPQGVATLLRDYRAILGYELALSKSDSIQAINEILNDTKPLVIVSLDTNKGVQAVTVESTATIPATVVEHPPVVPEAPSQEPAEDSEPMGIKPAPLAEDPPPAPKSKEVDLEVGMRIGYKTPKGSSTGLVQEIDEVNSRITILDDAMEMEVRIGPSAITRIIAD